MQNKKFIIIDAMAMAYRAYFAFINRPLVTSKGEPTSAVYGFINQLIKIFEDHKPDYIAVAFDSKEKTFRHDKYENYKSSRAKMPDDMFPQLDRIKQLIEVMNIPLYIIPRYEADDIIGTAACKAEQLGLETFIITPDKDFNQLITDKVKVIKPGGKVSDEIVVYDTAKVKEEFGFEPGQMIDYLALIGDSSDDIPGVAGVGPKTATPLIQKYGSIENLYNHIDEIEKPALKNKLIEGKENAILSKDLATIHCEVPLEFNFENAKFTKPDFDSLRKIIVELEFKDIYNRLLSIYDSSSANAKLNEVVADDVTAFDESKVKYKLIKNLKEAEELADYLSKKELIVFDTETDSLNQFELNIAGASFSSKEGEGFFIPLQPDNYGKLISNPDERLSIEDFTKVFKKLFENKKIKKVCQNAKFDIAVMRNIGISVENFYFDTMLASYVIDPDQKHGMDDLSVKYLKYKPIPLSDLIGPKKDSSKIFEVETEPLGKYASEDADITYRLYEILDKEIKKENLTKIAYDVEFPLIPILEDMEREGIKIDNDALKSLSDDLQILIDNYTNEIYKSCGEEFNINSTKQLQEILFNKLGLQSGKKTKTGFSTDAKSLEYLRGEHEVIELLLEYRQLTKLKSTYADALPNLINPKTGRIHTSFNQTVASTGRLSSNDPNLQNIPIRTDRGKEIRKAFVPRDKDHVILSADYSQIELRIMAHISEDEALSKAFKEKEDIHRSTAALVFMVKPEDVTPDMRRKAKEVNFGILYGIGPFGLKTRLGVTQTHAKEIITTYFKTFKRVKNFMDDSVIRAKEKGYAETILGRRRYLRNINSSNRVVRQFEERVAINMRVQGTAADMIKLAMINIYKELEKRKAKTKMVLQVHDELVFDAHKDEVDELRPVIKKLMEEALPLNVPVVVDTGIGDNWLDAH
ncbi:MAG: DNA polymerase I [Ignavibacteria bacterium GWA2_35_9]|nr:MAG: DNA polymerase I [Ignavibacteria bacterium GWA2_35_9]OGU47127.1 MAG: DNA polymerase I [Ignavibacteria bacterium GWB2_36_8]OGU49930.1 MAG: DNA polymerase I [Ignavibacteria bacterium GWC2_36_12]